MKKIISAFLCVAMLLASVASLNVSAAENQLSDSEIKLYYLHDICYREFMAVGGEDIHTLISKDDMFDVLQKAQTVLYDKNATDADYEQAYNELMYQAYNMSVYPDIVYDTYLNALKEENYNNWYSEEDWNTFVEKRDELKTVFDQYYDINERGWPVCKVPSAHKRTAESAVTNAFYALLKSYNVMTNRYTLMGDVNKDGKVDVQDVTFIQKSLVELEHLTGAQKILTGSYFYEEPTIDTVTNLQKYIIEDPDADMSDMSFVPETGHYDSYERRMERTFNFGICSRVPVTYPVLMNNDFYDTAYLDEFYSIMENKSIDIK